MKTLKIEIPNGFEIDKENSTFEQIVFKEIEKALPKNWKELKTLKGYYVNGNDAYSGEDFSIRNSNKNIFATEEQAKASIALAQLSQLREVYRNGWVPDFKNASEIKYCIFLEGNNITTNWFYKSNLFLSFQDEKTRDLFLENFKDLIEQAKPLMS
jgi:hypothetical protein